MVINHIEDAHALLDRAISSALRQRKPVYINIACNLAGEMHATFDTNPIPFAIYPKVRSPLVLVSAREHLQIIKRWLIIMFYFTGEQPKELGGCSGGGSTILE